MATETIRYVDPNAEVGGDGTTNALTGANCAFVSLGVWEAARQRDLPGADEWEHVYCSSDDAGSTHLADTTACTINGWTTDATRYIQIEAASSHGGKWNDTIYRLESETFGIDYAESYVRLSGIQVKVTGSSGTHYCLYSHSYDATCVYTFDKLILRGVLSSTADGAGIFIFANGGAHTTNLRNSLFYDFMNAAVACYGLMVFNSAANTFNVQNCTFQNSKYGIYNYKGTVNATNVGFSGCTTPTEGLTSATTCSTSTPTFVDGDNDDFHLAEGDSTWRGEGTDLSGTFTDDIDDETRSAWDIGCDEYVAAVTGRPWFAEFCGGLNYDMAGGL